MVRERLEVMKMYVFPAHEAEKWWSDERIRKRFARWGGGVGKHMTRAGEELLWAMRNMDSYNMEYAKKGLVALKGMSSDEIDEFLNWAFNKVPIGLMPWVGALLITGVPPKAMMKSFVDRRIYRYG